MYVHVYTNTHVYIHAHITHNRFTYSYHPHVHKNNHYLKIIKFTNLSPRNFEGNVAGSNPDQVVMLCPWKQGVNSQFHGKGTLVQIIGHSV